MTFLKEQEKRKAYGTSEIEPKKVNRRGKFLSNKSNNVSEKFLSLVWRLFAFLGKTFNLELLLRIIKDITFKDI